MFDIIAFDADDTLWHNEILYAAAQEKFWALLGQYRREDWPEDPLYEIETGNLELFGYGIKGFTLSMIETAIALTDGRITGSEIRVILDIARDMMESPVQLFENVREVIETLSRSHQLLLITKGDLIDQERKIAQSGLAPYFADIEIVRDKTIEAYRSLLSKHGILAQRFLMVGNSLRSDILPVIALGGHAVHIPYHITWEHENATVLPEESEGYVELEDIGLLPGYVEDLEKQGG